MQKKIITSIFAFSLLLISLPSSANSNIEFKKLDNKIVKLSDYKGKWVIVNYWATWCPPCRVEMPELSLFHEEHKNKDAIVLGVNYEDIDKKKVESFLTEQMINFPVVKESQAPNGKSTSFGALKGLPTTYMVSPTGEVVATRVGMVNQKMLEGFISKYNKMSKK